MMYERQGLLLLDRLSQRWGDEPTWTLRPNKDYGFFLLYRRGSVPLGEVRRMIEATFGFAPGPTFIIGDLPERPSPMPSTSHGYLVACPGT